MELKINWKKVSWLVVGVAVLFKLYIIFFQYHFHNFLVPPSPDLVSHLQMTDHFINGTAVLGSYPPLLHILTAFLAKLFSATSLEIYSAIGPYWIPAAIIVFYLLVYKIFDYKIAFWATLVFGLVSANPLLNFGDAQYADILGYNLIGPFYILGFISLIKDFKYWKIPLVFLLFVLFLSAHHLSAVLIYIVSVISLVISCIIARKKDKSEYKKSAFTLLVFVIGAFVFLALSRIFFGDLLSTVFDAVIHAKDLIQDSTSEVLDYSNIPSLLPALIEFVGLMGIGFLFIRITGDKKTRFASIFIIVWIVMIWIFSRSSLFVLPQRIFREISLPLSIAAGIFVVDISCLLKSRWQKIMFFSLFAYLVIINSVQLFVPPFLLPDGFKNQVWFRDVDQDKFEYIKENVPVGPVIMTNYSNTVLQYKLIKEGYSLKYFSGSDKDLTTNEQKAQLVQDEITQANASYLFIGFLPEGVNPDVYFTQYPNYQKATEILNTYQYKRDSLIKQFPDGSKLIRVNPSPTAK